MPTEFLLLAFLAYLLGSIPSGKIAGHLAGIDIQKKGSGNIGFANVLRVLGWKQAAIVLLADIIKGFVPVMLAARNLPIIQIEIVAFLALVGNIWPIWLKFKGGKGIATGLGATLAISPALAGLAVLIYTCGTAAFRRSASSSMLAAIATPFLCILIVPDYIYFYVCLALLAIWTHRSNVRKLLGFDHAG